MTTLMRKKLHKVVSFILILVLIIPIMQIPANAINIYKIFPSRISIANRVIGLYIGDNEYGEGNGWKEIRKDTLYPGTYNVSLPKDDYTYICIEYSSVYGYNAMHYWDGSRRYPTYVDNEMYASDGYVCPRGGTVVATVDKVTFPIDFDSETNEYKIYYGYGQWAGPENAEYIFNFNWTDIQGRPEAPEGPYLDYNDANVVRLVGADDTMEYRLGTSTSWNPCSDDMVFNYPSKSTNLYIRYSDPVSRVLKLTMLANLAAPDVRYDQETERFIGLDETHEISFNGGGFTPVDDQVIDEGVTPFIDGLSGGQNGTLQVRVAPADGYPGSAIAALPLYPRASAPDGISYDPDTHIVSGMDDSMSYRLKGVDNWIPYTAGSGEFDVSELLSSSNVLTLEVRYNCVPDQFAASWGTEIELSLLEGVPELDIDYAGERIVGFEDDVLYEFRTSTTQWSPLQVDGGGFSFAEMDNTNLLIRESATESSPVSEAVAFDIPAKADAPPVSFYYNNVLHPDKGVLYGVDTSMEYRKSGDDEWIGVTDEPIMLDRPDAPISYQVRIKGTDNARPSEIKELVLTPGGATPEVSMDSGTIAVGNEHSAILMSDGTVWTWGYNSLGQLGDGTTTSRTLPVKVPNLDGVKAIAAANSSTYALKDDGTVWAWGANASYQLGNGATTAKSLPQQVAGLTDVAAITVGSGTVYALKRDGSVWTWGVNTNGQAGVGNITNVRVPTQITGLPDNVVYISAGATHAHAICEDGKVYGWGNNGYGQLGDGTVVRKTAPEEISNLSGSVQIAGGGDYTLAIDGNGDIWSVGRNQYGQLGDDTTTEKNIPVKIDGIGNVEHIIAGSLHSIAIDSDGAVWTWGYNNSGQLGNGETAAVRVPAKISLNDIVQIDTLTNTNIALKADGSLWLWGANSNRQVTPTTTANQKSPVQYVDLPDGGIKQ